MGPVDTGRPAFTAATHQVLSIGRSDATASPSSRADGDLAFLSSFVGLTRLPSDAGSMVSWLSSGCRPERRT
jgi:hypothetical protein